MKVYFCKTDDYNEIIYTDGFTAKVDYCSPSGLFNDEIDICDNENAINELREFFNKNRNNLNDYNNLWTDEYNTYYFYQIKHMIDESDLIFDDGELYPSQISVTRAWKVYGSCDYYGDLPHRQRMSFFPSKTHDFSDDEDGVRILEFLNSDRTGTNDYTIVIITRNTAEECEKELNAQISDGFFEDSRVGKVEEIEIIK